ncbi:MULTISPECIES: DUF3482 domain-containing protein [unclassified Roseateles]|uniref:DUF3482 domain-containing protein n=1 Tax=unclassified Roseateles TaxID=2626991 RepID=UPI0006F3656B|nr:MULTISPECIES: DUF3482 domain-containing protein [unclassified Roseateles]KQW41225.1 hypothetical protein ASC81_23390 [Pelomonas sp. Root405]KRA67997.1 hypothetical protein ASD88_21375 [Pelomonas sp. Root662]
MKLEPNFVAPEAAARRVALLDWAESNAVGALWSAEDARWATQQARAEGATVDFRLARARHAAQRLGERDDRLMDLLARPLWSGSWALAALVVGLLLGLGVDRLGGQQLNLLTLPLWGVLALQLLSYCLLFVLAFRRPQLQVKAGPLLRLWQRLLTPGARGRAGQALAHWWRLSLPLQAARSALLWHIALLGLNLGLIAGLYLRALGLEILIGWESTYLDAAQVQRLADVLLAPAAWLTGLAVPDVAPLRHGALQGPQALAADWLHLLAATVALVALPRLLLVLHAAWRSWRLARALPLHVGSGPADLRLLLIDPQRRLAGSLLGQAGERLSSPEGDRLLVTQADAAPDTVPATWSERALALLHASPDPAPAFDAHVAADSLPAATPGWPAQRRQLRALGKLWPPARRPAWQRLFEAWEAPVREREGQARQLMAQALATLCLQPLHLPEGADPQAQLRKAVEQQLQLLADRLRELYGQDAAADALPSAAEQWPHQVVRPRPVVRNSVLGGAMGGAATGLGADLAAGGLTLGAGALIGAVVGGVAGSGLTEWLNRRQGRRTTSLQVDLVEAAPLLVGEVLNVWLAQIGLRLPAAQVDAAIGARAWVDAFKHAPTEVPTRLQPLLAQACERLLREVDEAAERDNPSAHNSAHVARS